MSSWQAGERTVAAEKKREKVKAWGLAGGEQFHKGSTSDGKREMWAISIGAHWRQTAPNSR